MAHQLAPGLTYRGTLLSLWLMMSAPLASPGALAYGSVRYSSELILEGNPPGSCSEGFQGDLVAEGLELGNGPNRFSSLVAAPGHAGLIRDRRLGRLRCHQHGRTGPAGASRTSRL
jgi:hypothetical protein